MRQAKPIIHRDDHRPGRADALIDLRWFYFTPVAPADEPADYISGDPDYVAWESPWGNIGGGQTASAFGVALGGKPVLKLAATGGEDSAPSLMATLPAWVLAFGEGTKHRMFISMNDDGTGIGVVEVDMATGDITFLAQII